jgi:hypothetical protein
MRSDQTLNAWMATKFYLFPIVFDFPHSWFLVPEIFWQAKPFLSNEEASSAVPFTNEAAIFCESSF